MKQTIAVGFASLEAVGFRVPTSYGTKAGLRAGVDGFAILLADLTPLEAEEAFARWMKDEGPWWPTPGQLRDSVPHLATSETEWKALQAGRGSTTALLVEKHLGDCDDVSFGRAYREYVRRWVALPAITRKLIGQFAVEGRMQAIERVGLLEAPLLRLEG